MRDQYMRGGQGFLLVYSITNRSTFEEMCLFREQIFRVKDMDSDAKNSTIPIVLVGNKCDLETQREVTVAEGQALAASFGVPFFETSALHRLNVDECFFQLVRECRKQDKRSKAITKLRRKTRLKGALACSIM